MGKLRFHTLTSMLIRGVLLLFLVLSNSGPVARAQSYPGIDQRSKTTHSPGFSSTVTILVDDFRQRPYQGDSLYYYNRLDGDRGAINNTILDWGNGLVKATISPGNTWGGFWESLNHPIREGLSVNFSAILPGEILPAYQSQITGITVHVAGGTPGRLLKAELKDGNDLRWSTQVPLSGSSQVITQALPPLGDISQFVLVLDNAGAGDFVIVEHISFTAVTQIADPAVAAFAWSYGMLLNNWNPVTGLVRDKSRDVSGEFDAIQSTGSLAAATAMADQLGIIDHNTAIQVVSKIGITLLEEVPRFHGLWPHWVKVSNGTINILDGTEWSSLDTVIAAIGLLDAQYALGLDTSGTQQMLTSIDWNALVTLTGISHGYDFNGSLISSSWDTFGGESWLVQLAYAAATGQTAPLTYSSPPTANGSGFIDELAWLFAPPPSTLDIWGTDWEDYRTASAQAQIAYYPTQYPVSCFNQFGLFGLSAAEVPDPSLVPKSEIYQPFGTGGQFASPNDGLGLLGAPVVIPHYRAMIASLHPQAASELWNWLIGQGYFSPLNNLESLMFPSVSDCDSETVRFNQMKGAWNLSLQALGWGRRLALHSGTIPAVWLASIQNPFLRDGYLILAPDGLPPVVVSSNRVDPNPTSKKAVHFTVTFSESVTGVDKTDFKLTTVGIQNASVETVSGSGTTWTITAQTGTGNGTLRLDVADDDTILDATNDPLGGFGTGNGDFTTSQVYTVKKVLALRSQGAIDGWVLESTETSDKGKLLNKIATTLRLGDDAGRKQYRSVLSFSTKGLPDNAVITKVTLMVRKQGILGGGNPVTLFQGFMVDVKKGFFGISALQAGDFQALANKSYGPFKPAAVNNWYSLNLTNAKTYINKLASNDGLTQIRLRFKLDDNNNGIANILSLYSGNAQLASRPQLIIEYYVP